MPRVAANRKRGEVVHFETEAPPLRDKALRLYSRYPEPDPNPEILTHPPSPKTKPRGGQLATDSARRRKLLFSAISTVTGEGVDKLKYANAERVGEHRENNPLLATPETRYLQRPQTKTHFPPPPLPKVSGSRPQWGR